MSTAKLSPMQRRILELAYAKRQAREVVNTAPNSDQSQPVDPRNGVDVYYAELLVELFGFAPRSDVTKPHGQHFSRAEIGAKRYDSAQASLSRAVGRLETRGLVEVLTGRRSRWSGVQLTEQGVMTMDCFPPS